MVSRRIICNALAALILVFTGLHPMPSKASDAAKSMLERLEADKPSWLPNLDKCPADAMPARDIKLDYSDERCTSALEQCVDRCRAGSGNDCYASALIFQQVRNGPVSEAFFLKACEMGIVSGCTNRAAGMAKVPGNPCAVRTFEKGCERDDPWACTMFGAHLASGTGTAKDVKRAKQIFSKSCRFGDTDQACVFAKDLLKQLGD